MSGWALPLPKPTEPIHYDHETAPAKPRPWWLLAVLVVLLGAVGAYFAFFRDGEGDGGTTVSVVFGETAVPDNPAVHQSRHPIRTGHNRTTNHHRRSNAYAGSDSPDRTAS